MISPLVVMCNCEGNSVVATSLMYIMSVIMIICTVVIIFKGRERGED